MPVLPVLTLVFFAQIGKSYIYKGSTVIRYRYDASGNRVYKEVEASGITASTWYVRDAQGNVLAT
ncbi:hypothetical protein [Flavihumibacter sp. UBA7668]|uniref:hypothetical protein n=1 Tax=Flavihumibacter sp. UBA7668 TaxID=1946542 RepID=UPI0025B9A0F6|nr:hypothetical protein [Flavihumibacter sp. UBA7668]